RHVVVCRRPDDRTPLPHGNRAGEWQSAGRGRPRRRRPSVQCRTVRSGQRHVVVCRRPDDRTPLPHGNRAGEWQSAGRGRHRPRPRPKPRRRRSVQCRTVRSGQRHVVVCRRPDDRTRRSHGNPAGWQSAGRERLTKPRPKPRRHRSVQCRTVRSGQRHVVVCRRPDDRTRRPHGNPAGWQSAGRGRRRQKRHCVQRRTVLSV
ncbi:hypothetical protein DFQ28_004335, partial [Apophysomyces sp. BC1034]